MDAYDKYPSEFDPPAAGGAAHEAPAEAPPSQVAPSAIGNDERRMHVRAYNYWVSLLEGRDFPSIEDLDSGDVSDFSGHSVLLDFTCGRDNPALPYIGADIREECGLGDDVSTIAEVPSRSLLSRLTDHYLQIIANRAPIGFEAEFANPHGHIICYRGILMPFSSDGDTIDFIYGVINWKNVGTGTVVVPSASEPRPVAEPEPIAEPEPLDLTEAVVADEPLALTDPVLETPEGVEEEADALPELVPDEDAGLADRLWAARETAESVKAGEGRTRAALYRALALAYDFAVAARENPEDYAELLEESGVKAQARAPMTPVVKLVFGVDYDKARLTEFAAALSYAGRAAVAPGGFETFIGRQPGGLKALVAAERQARRPEPQPDTRGDAARASLRAAAPLSLAELASADEFVLVVARRRAAHGGYEAVATVADEALVERAIRKVA
jgi:hypothetical protein